MKKTILIYMLIFALLLTSCGNTETLASTDGTSASASETTRPVNSDPYLTISYDEVYGYYGDDAFGKIENDVEFQQKKSNIDLTDYIPQEKLTFNGFKLDRISVVYSRNKNKERTGSHNVKLYWDKENCKFAVTDPNCRHMSIAIFSYPNVEQEAFCDGDGCEKKSETKENYVDIVDAGFVDHIYLINDNCVVRFTLKVNSENYDEIVAKADAYADYLRETYPKTRDEVK